MFDIDANMSLTFPLKPVSVVLDILGVNWDTNGHVRVYLKTWKLSRSQGLKYLLSHVIKCRKEEGLVSGFWHFGYEYD